MFRLAVVVCLLAVSACGPSVDDVKAALGAVEDTDVKGVIKSGSIYTVTAACLDRHAHGARVEFAVETDGLSAERAVTLMRGELRDACSQKVIDGLELERKAMAEGARR